MGYMTHFDGRITIKPPLRWADIKDTEWADPKAFPDFRIDVAEQREETDDGERIVKEGRAIIPASDDSYKGYDALSTLRAIVGRFPDHAFTGEIRAEGEEAADVRRYLVVDGEAVEWRAALTWPDGTREEAPRA
jgi:hypothetical protein